MDYSGTFGGTATFHCRFAFLTLDKKQMATFVGAIGMHVTCFAALVALRHNIVGDSFAQAVVKNKVFSDEFAFQPFGFDLARVLYDSAFELVYVFKPFVFEISAGLFATDSASAIHQEFFVLFMCGKLFFDNGQTFSKSVHIGFDGIGKMTYLAFVMVSHIDHNGIWIFK